MAGESVSLKRRVVITGLGVVSSTGMGREAFWNAVVEGRSGISYISGFDVKDLYCRIAGQIKDFDPTQYMERSEARRCGRFVHFAVAAAQMAIDDAEIDLRRVPPLRKGAACGTSVAGSGNITDRIYRTYFDRGPAACGPLDHLEMAPHAATSRVMIAHGMKGPSSSAATGCCSALEAVEVCRKALRSGAADVMVAAASEAVISHFGLSLLGRVDIMTR
ncbi:MAG: beta-ketoacyl synthase N-terminal-like domain-containing protein, partial [Armatimonadota bacterium]